MAKRFGDLTKKQKNKIRNKAANQGLTKKEVRDKYNERQERISASSQPSPTPAPSPAPTPAPTPTPTASTAPSASSSLLAASRDEPITGPTFEPSSSNDEPARSTAVERANNFANPDHYAENVAQKEIRDIKKEAVADIEKGSGGRKGWENRLDENTKSELAQAYDTIYGKDNIEDYNFAMGGKGSLKGGERISKADLKQLQLAGFSDQEIVDHVRRERKGDAFIGGKKAQRFLDKMIAGLNDSKEVITEPNPQPTQPGQPGQIPQPGGPTQPIESTQGVTQGGGSNNTVINEGSNTITNPGSSMGSSTEVSTGGTGITENISQIQDVNVTQGNQQEFNVNQNNDLNVAVTGNENVSSITQDNTVKNLGGGQSNTSNVTGPNANTGGSNFLQNYLYGTGLFDSLSNAGVDVRDVLSGYGNSKGTTNSYDSTTNQIQDINATQDTDQEFNVNQDNDLNAQITGDNNVSQISQDNSVRNYGGDQRNFTYISGANANGQANYLTDAPASLATMSGFYSPDDSPAANAAFADRYQTMNRDTQKAYNPFGTAEGYMLRGKGKNVGLINPVALRQQINEAPEIARARSDMANLNAYGDIYKAPTVRWNSTLGVFEPIEPYDPVKAAEEARKFFKD